MSKSSVPATNVNPSVPHASGSGEDYVFKKHELSFLREYSVSLDEKKALTAASVDSRRHSEIVSNPHVIEEMLRIQKAWRYRGRVTQEFAGGEHMRLMEKFENDYDKVSLKERSKMAGVLAKMSETTMKATKLIGSDEGQQMPTVILNMNMGDAEQVSVDVKGVDDGR